MYKFVLIKNGYIPNSKPYWMLLLDNKESTQKYLYSIRLKNLVDTYWKLKSNIIKNENKNNLFHFTSKDEVALYNSIISIENRETMVDDLQIIEDKFIFPLMKIFNGGNHLLIHPNKSWMIKTDNIEILKTVEKNEFEFPAEQLTEEDMIKRIKITKWEGGKHYYAKLGEEEIRDSSGNIKWNTYARALEVTKTYITEKLKNDSK